MSEDNFKESGVKRKRKLLARRRRKAFFRLILLIAAFAAIVSAVVFAGMQLVSFGENLYKDYQAMYAGYAERQEKRLGSIDSRFDGYTNILVLGLDEGVGEVEGVESADTVLIVSMDNATGKVRFVNIPPRTLVQTRSGPAQLGLLYSEGGAPRLVREVNSLLGISIHQYVVVDMKSFVKLVDALGGIDLYVEMNMDYEDPEAGTAIHLAQGYQHLDGEAALSYIRYKGEELKGVGRVKRQERFLRAVYEKALRLETVPRLPELATILQTEVETSAEIFDSAHLANVLKSVSLDTPETLMLPGRDDPTGFIPDSAQIDERIKGLFTPPEQPAE